MPAKSSVEQVAQVGVEGTPGVPAAATWRPRSVQLTMQPHFEVGEVRASGAYFTSSTYETAEWSEGSAEGVPCFNESTNIFPLVFGSPTVSTPVTGVTRRVYQFGLNRPTWTVEYGDAAHSSRAAFVHATGISFEWGKNSRTATVNLSLGGGEFVDGHTLTDPATVTNLSVRPVTALLVDVFADASAADYGLTRLTNAINVRVNLDNLAAGKHYLDSRTRSISQTVNTVPDASIELTLEADGPGRAWLDRLKKGETRYVRIIAHGNVLVEAQPATGTTPATPEYRERLVIDVPVQVVEVGERGDEDDVFVASYTLRMVDNGASRLTVTLDNGLA